MNEYGANNSYTDEIASLKENSVNFALLFFWLFEANLWDSMWEISA